MLRKIFRCMFIFSWVYWMIEMIVKLVNKIRKDWKKEARVK